ncbi:hypothetical protein FRX31_023963 [Thalictrum thalictroides]|uniref:Uncharacterized protein n=1 Tax=Thalictrum thalictroides TaxID=46969 RepID=A0A7J6VQJ4_THATH|nr:hypothetical protein FRX31_023963 [Thalictrum thalictroides]
MDAIKWLLLKSGGSAMMHIQLRHPNRRSRPPSYLVNFRQILAVGCGCFGMVQVDASGIGQLKFETMSNGKQSRSNELSGSDGRVVKKNRLPKNSSADPVANSEPSLMLVEDQVLFIYEL